MSGREQRRLLMLVLALGAVFILMCEARKPRNWRWIQGDAAAGKTEPPRAESREGGLILAANGDSAKKQPDEKPLPAVDRELLKSVQDNTRFRNEENAAWFNLLGILQQSSQKQLRRESADAASWLQLQSQPAEYRGKLVAVRGVVRRANRVDAVKNDKGIDGYYQLWMEPNDDAGRPIVIYCLKLPKNFPTGMELSEPVEAAGFYFKRWLYMGQEDLETAPVVLAKTIEWEKRAEVRPETSPPLGFDAVLFVIAAGGLLGLSAFAYIYYVTRGRPRKTVKKQEDLIAKREEPEE
jgi:hypothetical protein